MPHCLASAKNDSKTVIFHQIKFKSFPAPIVVSPSGTIDCGHGRIFSRTVMTVTVWCAILLTDGLTNSIRGTDHALRGTARRRTGHPQLSRIMLRDLELLLVQVVVLVILRALQRQL